MLLYRLVAAAVVTGLLLLVYDQMSQEESKIGVTQAIAVPMAMDGTFMVTLDMQNAGTPVALTGLRAIGDGTATIMGGTGALVVPGEGGAQLAMDGAHGMLTLPEGQLLPGAFQPIALDFSDGTSVTAQAFRPEEAQSGTMDHSLAHGVVAEPAPVITIDALQVTATGVDVTLSVQNLALVSVPDDTPHVAGEGHAHIYLNGLKLGRLYDTGFVIGALLPGDYVLTIAVNSHDHRPYLAGGQPIMARAEFTLP